MCMLVSRVEFVRVCAPLISLTESFGPAGCSRLSVIGKVAKRGRFLPKLEIGTNGMEDQRGMVF